MNDLLNFLIGILKAVWWGVFVGSMISVWLLGLSMIIHHVFPSVPYGWLIVLLAPVTVAYAYGVEVLLNVKVKLNYNCLVHKPRSD